MRLGDAPQWAHAEPDRAGSVPSFAFDPTDPWTSTFQAGLERAELRGRRVYEVGVGSGTNVEFMLRACDASMVFGSDLDPRLAAVASTFVSERAPTLRDRFRPIDGPVSLIDAPVARATMAETDVVVGCLPQVPDPQEAASARFRLAHLTAVDAGRQLDDRLAHYYPWEEFDEHPFNAVGLGLIEALLTSVRAHAPQAEVILILGCRIGKDHLTRLFRSNGYHPQILASRIVRQHARTDISFFAALEAAMRGTGYEREFVCEFYADEEGRLAISASEATERLNADPAQPVFHEVCVIRGRRV